VGGGASNWREVRKLLLLPDSRNSQRAHLTAQSFRSSHEFLITLRVACHVSRVTCHASRCFRYGFTQVPGGSAWANKSVLSWHNSVLGSITPDDTCALHAVACAIDRARFVHVLHMRVCCALVPACMRPSTNGKPRYYSWKHSEMLRLGCGGWVTETGDSQLPLLDSWQVQPHASPMIDRIA